MSIAQFFSQPITLIAGRRFILASTTITELRRRYAGSVFGPTWVVLGPALLMALYTVIYAVVFRVRPLDFSQADYIIYIFCGLVPYLGFSEALLSGSTSLSANKEMLLNTMFPADLVPLRAVLIASVSTVVGLLLLVVGNGAIGHFSWTLLLVPVVVVLQVAFVTGVVWVLSLANLVMRDIQQFLVYLNVVLLIASPIAYTPSMIPSSIKLLIYINPLSYFVISMQHLVLLGTLPPPGIAIGAIILSLTSFFAGHWVFRRAKTVFFDYA